MKEPETPIEWIVCGLTIGATVGVGLAALCAVLIGSAFLGIFVASTIAGLLS